MKKHTLFISFGVIAIALFFLNARGGGGGGRGGGARSGSAVGGGAARGPSRSTIPINPSPSMSRPATRPAARPATRPVSRQQAPRAPQPNFEPPRQAPVARSGAKPATRPPRNAEPLFNPQANTFSRDTRQASRQVQSAIRSSYPTSRNWFNEQFFANHRYDTPLRDLANNWWGYPAWGALGYWYPSWGWSEPLYYDYAGEPQAMPVYVQGGYEAQNQIPAQAEESGWLPLGVFAAGEDVNSAAYSNMIFQLAVDREGTLGGTYYNTASDKTHPLEGRVMKDTQRIYWRSVSDEPTTVMMTGMYNLTQDVAPVQVLFTDGSLQTWVLVRLGKE